MPASVTQPRTAPASSRPSGGHSSAGASRSVSFPAWMEGGQVRYEVDMGGRDYEIPEQEDACLRAFWVTGVTLTDVQLTPDGTLVYTVKEL